MRSESLRRQSLPKPKQSGPTITSEELALQVNEFLASGGEIQTLPAQFMTEAGQPRPAGKSIKHFPMTAGQEVTEDADGQTLYNTKKTARVVGWSEAHILTLRKRDGFPAPRMVDRKAYYVKSEIEAWMESHPERCRKANGKEARNQG